VTDCPAETQKCTGDSGCCPKDMFCISSSPGGLACCPTSISPSLFYIVVFGPIGKSGRGAGAQVC